MLTIRFQRVGRKNKAMFRLVLAEKHRHASKQVTEILGHYNPHTKDFALRDSERLKYWLSEHVEVSPSVHNLLVTKGILAGQKKVQAWKAKKKESAKADAPVAGGNTPAPTEKSPAEIAPETPVA